MLTQSKLKEYLNYNPETGVFTRLVSTSHNAKAGDVAGGVCCRGYSRISVEGGRYKSHRLAWLYMSGAWPRHEIDHINHIKTDNRFINLREVTRQENMRNQTKGKTNKSGIIGVCWSKAKSKWDSNITVDGKTITLGCFKDKFEAICARKSAENKHGYHANHGRN